MVVINLFRDAFDDATARYFYLGVGLVAAAIACEACYTLIGKKATEHPPPLFTSFMASALSIPLFLILALIDYGDADLSGLGATDWVALVWWGVGTLGAGSALWYAGVARTDGTTAAGFMAVMPLSALVLSYLLLGESLEPVQALGIVLVLVSVALMSWVHVESMKSDEGETSEPRQVRDARLLATCQCPDMLPRTLTLRNTETTAR